MLISILVSPGYISIVWYQSTLFLSTGGMYMIFPLWMTRPSPASTALTVLVVETLLAVLSCCWYYFFQGTRQVKILCLILVAAQLLVETIVRFSPNFILICQWWVLLFPLQHFIILVVYHVKSWQVISCIIFLYSPHWGLWDQILLAFVTISTFFDWGTFI